MDVNDDIELYEDPEEGPPEDCVDCEHDGTTCGEHGCPECHIQTYGPGDCPTCSAVSWRAFAEQYPGADHEYADCLHCEGCGLCAETGRVCRECYQCLNCATAGEVDSCTGERWDRVALAPYEVHRPSLMDPRTKLW